MPNCIRCNQEYECGERLSVYCPRCSLFYVLEPLTWEQYQARLAELYIRVQHESLTYYADTMIGNKDSSVTWGLCAKNLPHSDYKRQDWQICPFDRLRTSKGEPLLDRSGCFYRCRMFNRVKRAVSTKRQALRLLYKCMSWDEPELALSVWCGTKEHNREIMFPRYTTKREAKMAVAGIKLAHPKDGFLYVRARLIAWPSGPPEAQEIIEERNGDMHAPSGNT